MQQITRGYNIQRLWSVKVSWGWRNHNCRAGFGLGWDGGIYWECVEDPVVLRRYWLLFGCFLAPKKTSVEATNNALQRGKLANFFSQPEIQWQPSHGVGWTQDDVDIFRNRCPVKKPKRLRIINRPLDYHDYHFQRISMPLSPTIP